MREFISCTIQQSVYPKKRKNSIGVDQDSLNSLSNHHKGTWDV